MNALLFAAATIVGSSPATLETRAVTVGGRSITAQIVRVRLSEVEIRVGLAQDRVGPTESLAALAKRKGALAAINGSFFDAYVERPIKSPHHTVITNGEVVHVGNVGSLIGFRSDGTAQIGRLPLTIRGARDGREEFPHRWLAYWINRFPTAATVTIFTPAWGRSTGLAGGKQFVVDGGLVTDIGPGPKAIPVGGFVVYQSGVNDSSLDRIALRSGLSYRVANKDLASGDWGVFRGVRDAVGAGPTLVRDGKISLDAAGEGFRDPKILTMSGARSAVGLTANGELLLVASGGTLAELASLMQKLGCRHAMNLDGGASSGLYHQGRMIRTPGRLISNALLVMPKR